MRRLSLLSRLATGAAIVLLLAVAVAWTRDRLATPERSWKPVRRPSALDRGGPSLPNPPSPPSSSSSCSALPERWLVVGWDGADWRFLGPLLERGELPHLGRLMRQGAYGDLLTFEPTLSPAIWTTVATGVSPRRHGIAGFYNQQPPLGRWWLRLRNFGRLPRQLFSNADRRAPAVWNLLSEAGRPVLVSGYHNTFPAEPVRGAMVSNYLVQDHVGDLMEMEGVAGSPFAASLASPGKLLPEVLEIAEEVRSEIPDAVDRLVDLAPTETRDFLRRSRELGPEEPDRPYFTTRSWSFDETYTRVAEHLLPRLDPDLALVHLQGIDWVSHHFLFFGAPWLFEGMPLDGAEWERLRRRRERYDELLETTYRIQDARLGRLLEAAGPGTAVLLLSDHGFDAQADPVNPGYHDEAPPGILILSGPGIRARGRLDDATIYDILPTLMAGLGEPVARDLRGRVLDEAFCDRLLSSRPIERVATYAAGSWVPEIAPPPALEHGLLDQLESLGYLD